jgi:hypothetical protein
MKTKIYIFILVFSANMNSWAQLSINDYKYVSVSNKFDFLKSNDQYQLNSLTEFLFKKNGFTVLDKSDNYPTDLAKNNCLLLNANVVKIKGMLSTKLQIVLTNCKNITVFSSEIGKSKLKEFRKAYHEALRDAFDLSEFNYDYVESKNMDVVSIPTPPTPPVELAVNPDPVVVVTETIEEKAEEIQEAVESVSAVEVAMGLIVQQTKSGYDFIDTVTKIVKYATHATLFENVYIIDGQEGIIYKRGQSWVREYIENGNTTIEALNTQR